MPTVPNATAGHDPHRRSSSRKVFEPRAKGLPERVPLGTESFSHATPVAQRTGRADKKRASSGYRDNGDVSQPVRADQSVEPHRGGLQSIELPIGQYI